MPLNTTPSRKAFKENLKRLRAEGKPKAQALAISLQKAGKAKKSKTNIKSRKALIAAIRG